ncbi:MAG: DUF3592 domain-containing protein [Planctomycetales bacterium]|nr:DUF3592 domain-containing protein [Planctomycetales bacterium]
MKNETDAIWPMPNNHLGCFLGGLAFSGVIALTGAAILYWGFYVPHRDIRRSQSWIETPCVILEAEVTEGYSGTAGKNAGPGSYDYGLRVRYRYDFEGQEYVSSRFAVTEVSDSREQWRREVAESIPPGANTVCFVNPDDPEEAALSREFHANYRVALVPAAFLLLGLLGTVCMLMARAPDKPTPARNRSDSDSGSGSDSD